MSSFLDATKLVPLKDVIRAGGLAADKRLGQHFLLDPAILARIASAAALKPDAAVFEVGPGPGGLTRALLLAGAKVTAVERDPRCLSALASLEAWAQGRLRLVKADALTIEPGREIGHRPFSIVANLPYNIGTELLIRWLLKPEGIEGVHIMLQKEVVDRLAAHSGSKAYGRLSILAQLTTNVTRRFDLPSSAFHPPPKVTSTLVSLIPRSDAPTGELLAAIQQLTHAVFQQRRKMLRSSLKGLSVSVETLLDGSDVTPDQRPETLAPATFLQLATRLVAMRAN